MKPVLRYTDVFVCLKSLRQDLFPFFNLILFTRLRMKVILYRTHRLAEATLQMGRHS